ncbi:MAG: hypothetical protein ISEC1_P1015 [Thiomicrorhabdus sp.]|nr:MAG: hypothetical protein ISEC1_P1015 [Thiomicrorhabdus sp.]
MRAIVFLLLVVLVFLIIRFVLNRIIEIRSKLREAEGHLEDSSQSRPETMVKCAFCSVHLPESSAYHEGDDAFCSQAHMQEFKDKQANESSD